jgi:hypothetical protein
METRSQVNYLRNEYRLSFNVYLIGLKISWCSWLQLQIKPSWQLLTAQHSQMFLVLNLFFSLKKLCSKSAGKKKIHSIVPSTFKWTPMHRWLDSDPQFDLISCSSYWFYLKQFSFSIPFSWSMYFAELYDESGCPLWWV